jgi:hypothetical protein
MTLKDMKKRSSKNGRGVQSKTLGGAALVEFAQDDDSIASVQRRLLQLPTATRRGLTSVARLLLMDEPALSQKMRIVAAKVLVADLPRSSRAITALLRRFTGAHAYEVHFSLFVFLSDAKELKGRIAPLVRRMITTYLATVPSGTARAAWMAGHALGGHLQDVETRNVLAGLMHDARYAAGRRAAVRGMGELLSERPELVDFAHKESLRQIALKDRSRLVRAAAVSGSERLRTKGRRATGRRRS